MAGRFRFRLESLLKLRHSLEEVAQRTLATALAAQEAIRLQLAQLRQAEHMEEAMARGTYETLLAQGVTAIEIKSGYGLSLEDEATMLRVARRLGAELL